MCDQCLHCSDTLIFLTFHVKNCTATYSEGELGEEASLKQSGEIQPLSPIPAPEKDDTGRLAWLATTFPNLHRQENKSL